MAGRGRAGQTVEAPGCREYSNTPGFLPGREAPGCVPDLESEVVVSEQAWQKVMDTEGPRYWHQMFCHTGLPWTWKKQLCPGP